MSSPACFVLSLVEKNPGISQRPSVGSLRAPHPAVVDCAYGRQKENQEETNEIEENRRQEGDLDQEVNQEEWKPQEEIGEEEAISEKRGRENESGCEENRQRKACGCR